MWSLHRTTRFKRSFKHLPKFIQDDFIKLLFFFEKDPFDKRLRTHKLHGELGEYYSFCFRDGYRVLFDFVEKEVILFINIGNHDDFDPRI